MPIDLSPDLVRKAILDAMNTQQAEHRLDTRADEASPSAVTPLNPALTSALGAAADASMTYAGLKAGHPEGNPMYGALNNKPGVTALAVGAANYFLPLLARQAAKKFAPRLLPLADAYSANTAANSMRAAGEWGELLSKEREATPPATPALTSGPVPDPRKFFRN